jgi:two-component system, cell cycle sensor histidine kinase and response regulator CckA
MSQASPASKEIVILVVDDEVVVRNLVQRVLSSEGFSVLVATNGREALQLCVAFSGTIDMLLTDVEMPEMDGFQLAEQILISKPRMGILFMSGKLADTRTEPANFISKPFQPRALLIRVRETLSDLLSVKGTPPLDAASDAKLLS